MTAAPLAAVVLAAGSARRFGSDKLSAQFRGEPLVRHAIRAARAAPVDRVIVVAAPGLDIGAWPGDPPVAAVRVAARLAAALGRGYAAIPRSDGRNGHPVLLSRRAFADIARLEGDEGAGKLLKARDDVAFVDGSAKTVLLDIDRVEDLARLEHWGDDEA